MRILHTTGAALITAILLSSPVKATEDWPHRPVCWPEVAEDPCWHGEDCFHIGAAASLPPTVHAGGLFASGGLFFKFRVDLDLFLGPLRAIGPNVRILPWGHPLVALETIDGDSGSGLVSDEHYGNGFWMVPLGIDQRWPGWTEYWPVRDYQRLPFVRRPGGPPRLRRVGACCLNSVRAKVVGARNSLQLVQ